MSAGCGHCETFYGTSPAFKRALWAVIAINAVMFAVEMAAGTAAQSQALKADALDFAADSATYALSLFVIGRSAQWRSGAALVKATSLMAMGLAILGLALWRAVVASEPEPVTMSSIALLALLANLASVGILLRWRDGDSNVRSVWLCSRNDAIGNVAVLAAAGLVALTGSHWPDVVTAAIMAGLFVTSSVQIFRQARDERQAAAAV